jgi:hypothetical protein
MVDSLHHYYCLKRTDIHEVLEVNYTSTFRRLVVIKLIDHIPFFTLVAMVGTKLGTCSEFRVGNVLVKYS